VIGKLEENARRPPFGAPVAAGWLAVEDAPELAILRVG
jgi:hypothetical protein